MSGIVSQGAGGWVPAVAAADSPGRGLGRSASAGGPAGVCGPRGVPRMCPQGRMPTVVVMWIRHGLEDVPVVLVRSEAFFVVEACVARVRQLVCPCVVFLVSVN
jgi:hypothetical protein